MAVSILNRSRQQCSQTATGVYTLGSSINLYQTIEQGIVDASGTVAEGQEAVVIIQYADGLFSGDWTRVRVRFESGQLIRVETLRTQVGPITDDSDLDFNQAQTLIVYGTVDQAGIDATITENVDAAVAAAQHPGPQILQTGSFRGTGQWGSYTTDHNTTTFTAATVNSLVVPATSATSTFVYSCSAGILTERSGVAGSGVRSRVQMYHRNSSGTFINSSDSIEVGFFSMPNSDTNFGVHGGVALNDTLLSGERNQNDEWEIKPYIRIVDINTFVTLNDLSVNWMEIG